MGKREFVNTDFGEIVPVRSVAGQKLIKRNKCSVLSQARIRRAQGNVSSGDTLRLVLLPFQPSLGKYGGTYLRGFGFYFSSHFKICISIHAVQHLQQEGQLHRLGTRLGKHITSSTSELCKAGKTLRFMNWDFP